MFSNGEDYILFLTLELISGELIFNDNALYTY